MKKQKAQTKVIPLKSIYFEDKPGQGEFKMVQLATKRDLLVRNLVESIGKVSYSIDVKKDTKADDSLLIECFALHIAVREATLDLIDQISSWQQGFTKSRRPILNESDYIIKMPSTIEFACNSVMSRLFKYLIKTGDILLLPVPRRLKSQPIQVIQPLGDQIRIFYNPSRERILNAYRILQECVSEKFMKSFLPIEDWMENPWCPAIEVIASPDAFSSRLSIASPSPIRRSTSISSIVSRSSVRSVLSAFENNNNINHMEPRSVTFSYASGSGNSGDKEDECRYLPTVRGVTATPISTSTPAAGRPSNTPGLVRSPSKTSFGLTRQTSKSSIDSFSSSPFTSPVLPEVVAPMSTANMRQWYLSLAASIPVTTTATANQRR